MQFDDTAILLVMVALFVARDAASRLWSLLATALADDQDAATAD